MEWKDRESPVLSLSRHIVYESEPDGLVVRRNKTIENINDSSLKSPWRPSRVDVQLCISDMGLLLCSIFPIRCRPKLQPQGLGPNERPIRQATEDPA